MSQSIVGAVANIQAKALSLTGILAAPANPPEGSGVLPFSVCYPRSGELESGSAGWGNGLHTLVCELHFSRVNLPAAVATATPFIESFMAKLANDPTLGGTVSTVRNNIRYTFGKLEWGTDENIGIQFEIDIKISQTF